MASIERGDYYSWTIISDTIAIKHMDKSCFDHHGSGIPQEIVSFFVPESDVDKKRFGINLKSDNITYDAHIKKDELSRYQIHWQSDFVESIHSRFEYHHGLDIHEYPHMRFRKIDLHSYEITFTGELIFTDPVLPEEKRVIDADLLNKLLNRKTEAEIEVIVEEMFIDDMMPVMKKAYVANKLSRNREVSEYVKKRAGYRCELCGLEGFMQANGKQYAEAHHLFELAKMKDESRFEHPDYMICLCPRCHRIVHYGSDEEIDKIKPSKSST